MPSNRIGRINEEIQRELSDQLRRLKDPRVSATGMVSITRVDTTGDLRYARIYVSTLDKARETEVLKGLKSAAGFLRRELGRALQNDERYIAMMAARQASDEDEALQEAIGEFNLKRMAISNEAQKEERDDETLRRLNDEFRAVYQKIMENEHMLRYNDAKNEFDALLQQMTGILSLCAEGEDPATCDASSCGGNCASCGGCH